MRHVSGQLDHLDGIGKPAQVDEAVGQGDGAGRQSLEVGGWHEHFPRSGGVAETGGQIDGRADVVVAFEQQCVSRRHAYLQRQRCTGGAAAVFEIECDGDGIGLVDGHHHRAVSEPLGDADPAFRRDVAHDRSKRRQHGTGGVVAMFGGVVREPREIEENECSRDAHEARIWRFPRSVSGIAAWRR